MSFAKRLKKLRLEYEMSQEDLAKKLNCTRSAISGYELGRNEPSFEILNMLSELFNVSVSYLTCKTDDSDEKIIEPKDLKEKWRNLLIENEIDNFGIFKDLSISDLTEEDILDLLEAAKKIKNRHL